MQIPLQLKIGAHHYTVHRADLDERRGETDNCALTITLDESLRGTSLGATFIHEVVHCLNSELDHSLLDSLSEQLFQVLWDNGLLALDFTDP